MTGFSIIIAALVLTIYILPIVLFFKLWGMTNDIRLARDKILFQDKTQDAKVAFLKGDNTKAQELLDVAFFNEVLALTRLNPKKSPYDKNYPIIAKKYNRLYYRMNLVAPQFDLYSDINNLP